MARRNIGVVLAAVVAAGCGATGGGAPATAAPSAVVMEAPTVASTPAPTAPPTAAPTTAPTAEPTATGPVVITSKQYPYQLTVPNGPVGFIGAPASWDGLQSLSTDARTADRVRVPGAGLMFIAMTTATTDLDAYADEMEAKFEGWHGCIPTSERRPFTAGGLKGVAFSQSCGNGGHSWVRALIVDDGRGFVAMSDGGTMDGLIQALGGLEFVDP